MLSMVRWRSDLAQGMDEIGQELFLAGNNVAQFVNARFDVRIINSIDKRLIADNQEQRALRGNVGDKQGGEIVDAAETIRFKRLH